MGLAGIGAAIASGPVEGDPGDGFVAELVPSLRDDVEVGDCRGGGGNRRRGPNGVSRDGRGLLSGV